MHRQNLLSLFRNNQYVLLILLFSLLLSCKKDEVKPLYKNGVIEGSINSQYPVNPELITVKAVGPYGEYTIKVSKDEFSSSFRYKFTGLGNGTYKVSALKDSFGTVDYYNVAIFGNDTVSLPIIHLIPVVREVTIPQSPVYESQDYNNFIFSNFPLRHQGYHFIAFMSSKADVSEKKYQCYCYVEPFDQVKIKIYKHPSFFKKGTKVYIVIYPTSLGDSGYFNAFYGLEIFSSIAPDVHSQTFTATIE